MGFDSTYLDYVAIGNKIRELRHIHNLSQTELADQLGITAAGFSLIERGLSKRWNEPFKYPGFSTFL